MLLSIPNLLVAVLCVNAVSGMLARRLPVRTGKTIMTRRSWHRSVAEMEKHIQETYSPAYARKGALFMTAMLLRTFVKPWRNQDTARLLALSAELTVSNGHKERPLLVTDKGIEFFWNPPGLTIKFPDRHRKYSAEIRFGKLAPSKPGSEPGAETDSTYDNHLAVSFGNKEVYLDGRRSPGLVTDLSKQPSSRSSPSTVQNPDHYKAAYDVVEAVYSIRGQSAQDSKPRIDQTTVERAKSAIAVLSATAATGSPAARLKAVAAVLLHSLDPELVTIADARGIVGAFPTVDPYSDIGDASLWGAPITVEGRRRIVEAFTADPYSGMDEFRPPILTETGLKVWYRPWKYSITYRGDVICQIYPSKEFASYLRPTGFTPLEGDYFHFDLNGIVFAVAHEDGRFRLHGRVRMDGRVVPSAEPLIGEILEAASTCWTGCK